MTIYYDKVGVGMYIFDSNKIMVTVKNKPISHFYNYNDLLWQRELTIVDIKELIKPYLTNKRMGLSKMDRNQLGKLFEDFTREATGVVQSYVEDVFLKYGELIQRNKELWDELFLRELGVKITCKEEDNSRSRGSYYSLRKYGKITKYDIVDIFDSLAPFHEIFAENYVNIQHTSWGSNSLNCFVNNNYSFNPLAGETYYFTFNNRLSSYSYKSYSMANNDSADKWIPSSIEDMHKIMVENANRITKFERAKEWYLVSNKFIEETLHQEFGDRYTNWRTEIPKTM